MAKRGPTTLSWRQVIDAYTAAHPHAPRVAKHWRNAVGFEGGLCGTGAHGDDSDSSVYEDDDGGSLALSIRTYVGYGMLKAELFSASRARAAYSAIVALLEFAQTLPDAAPLGPFEAALQAARDGLAETPDCILVCERWSRAQQAKIRAQGLDAYFLSTEADSSSERLLDRFLVLEICSDLSLATEPAAAAASTSAEPGDPVAPLPQELLFHPTRHAQPSLGCGHGTTRLHP